VAETNGLLNRRRGLTSTESSNLSPSASVPFRPLFPEHTRRNKIQSPNVRSPYHLTMQNAALLTRESGLSSIPHIPDGRANLLYRRVGRREFRDAQGPQGTIYLNMRVCTKSPARSQQKYTPLARFEPSNLTS
jgi:hypothetical protein